MAITSSCSVGSSALTRQAFSRPIDPSVNYCPHCPLPCKCHANEHANEYANEHNPIAPIDPGVN